MYVYVTMYVCICICNYLIVESITFVLLRDVSPVNPKKMFEMIDSRMYLYKPSYEHFKQTHPLNL